MKFFPGFSNNKDQLTTLPDAFFTDLLPIIDHLGELKVTLYSIWLIEQQEGNFRHINYQHYLSDNDFIMGFGKNPTDAVENIKESLQRACDRGILLCFRQDEALWEESIYFMNSPSGRASLLALHDGKWSPDDLEPAMIVPMVKRPNIYKIYEANIGPLTPIMAETLQEAEDIYPAQWIEDAMQLAVENNVRRWRYVQAILNSWKERGRDEKDRRDAQEDPRRFLDGEFGEFFKH